MQVSKWGNSLAIRIPAAVAETLDLKEGDEVEVHVAGERAFGITRDRRRRDAVERIRAFRKELPPDWKFDRGEANARRTRHHGRLSIAMCSFTPSPRIRARRQRLPYSSVAAPRASRD